MSEPWLQRQDEPAEAYARFLIYKNLGCGRSLLSAYAAYLAMNPEAKKGNKKLVPGQWADDSARFEWVARSVAWDVHHLQALGPELVTLWTSILVGALRKAAQKLADPRCKPTSYLQCVAVVGKIAPYLTPELCRALTERQSTGAPDGDGADPGFIPFRTAPGGVASAVSGD